MKKAGKVALILALILLVAIPMFVFAGGGGERRVDYPTRPVELLIPQSAGGLLDINARAVVAHIQPFLGQPMTITLRPGGAGVIGTTEIARADPDGYRLLLGANGPNTIVPQVQNVAYDIDSFISIARIGSMPRIIVVPGDSPYRTMQELINGINANPGRLNYSTSGANSHGHIPSALLWDSAGVLGRIQPIHFDGGGPQLVALLAGDVDVGAVFTNQIYDHVRTGRLRPLGIASAERMPASYADGLFANVPTLTELGHPVVFSVWMTVMTPAGTPEPIVRHLRNTFAQLFRDADFAEMLERVGGDVAAYMDGPDFQRVLESEWYDVGPIIERIRQLER